MVKTLTSSLLLLLIASCGDQPPVTTPVGVTRVAPEVGATAPGFVAPDSSGRSVSLADFRGKVVMLDFWATWCGPCIVDLPKMKDRWARYKEKDFQIVGISLDFDLAAWRSFLRDEKIDWVNIAEGREWDSEIARRYNIYGIPSAFVIGRDGVVLAADVRGAQLDSALARALRE